MEIWLWIVVGVVAGVVVLMLLGRRAAARPGVDPTQMTFDADLMTQVRALTLEGKKIHAIALLRERTPGLPLVTAKLIVDRLEAAAKRPAGSAEIAAVPPAEPTFGALADASPGAGTRPDQPRADEEILAALDYTPSSSTVSLEVELAARNLKAQGNSAAAVALVRDESGLDLLDATDYVENL